MQLPEAKVHSSILRAIAARRLLRFVYKGQERIAEPHDYGIQKGSARLLSYQVGGKSSSGKLPAWRWIEVNQISALEVLDRTFPGGRGAASSQHHHWDQLFARVAEPES